MTQAAFEGEVAKRRIVGPHFLENRFHLGFVDEAEIDELLAELAGVGIDVDVLFLGGGFLGGGRRGLARAWPAPRAVWVAGAGVPGLQEVDSWFRVGPGVPGLGWARGLAGLRSQPAGQPFGLALPVGSLVRRYRACRSRFLRRFLIVRAAIVKLTSHWIVDSQAFCSGG